MEFRNINENLGMKKQRRQANKKREPRPEVINMNVQLVSEQESDGHGRGR